MKTDVQNKVEDVTNAIDKITATEAGIAELKSKYDNVVYDVQSHDGMREAKAARKEIRQPRYAIENLRKAAKAPVLELGRSIDATAESLKSQILALETPIDDQIKTEEKRVADIEAEIARKEQQRIDDIQGRIAAMYDGVAKVLKSDDPDFIKRSLYKFLALPLDGFEEFRDDAEKVFASGRQQLEKHLEDAIQKRKDAEELAMLRREKEQREAAEAAEAAEAGQAAAEVVSELVTEEEAVSDDWVPDKPAPKATLVDCTICERAFDEGGTETVINNVQVAFCPICTASLKEFAKKVWG